MPDHFQRYNQKTILGLLVFSLFYFLWAVQLIGYRREHLWVYLIIVLGWLATSFSRKFVLSFIPIFLFAFIYDSMRILPNYKVNTVHIIEPYNFEKSCFGLWENNVLITPNEYFEIYNSTFWDVLCGFFYLSWIPVPLALACFLFIKNKPYFLRFSIAFLLVNVLGFIIYYIYPAAPPWYFANYGLKEVYNIPGDAAGLLRFDEFFNINMFKDMYKKASNVFAAIPSLHSAYPVIVFYYALKLKSKLSFVFFILMIGIWFTAVYTGHHYIIDVILGALCAVLTLWIWEKWILKNGSNSFLEKYLKLIE